MTLMMHRIEILDEVLAVDGGRGRYRVLRLLGARPGRPFVGIRLVLQIRHAVEIGKPVLELHGAEVVRIRVLHALRDLVEDRLAVARLLSRARLGRRGLAELIGIDHLLAERVVHLLPGEDRFHVGDEVVLRR